MHKLNTIKYGVYLIAILVLAYALPQLWDMATDKAAQYPFAYYSSVNNTFCYNTHSGDSVVRADKKGNHYTKKEFDSVLPMMYYRQLALEGRLPDTLNGMAIDAKTIRSQNFFFRYRPREKFSPTIKLYTLFESMSGKVDLEMPGDMFRFTNEGIQFIDPETNTVKEEKSQKFTAVFKAMQFKGKPLLVAGNQTIRKHYDEGYLIVDQAHKMFHLKMVNGQPFIKIINLPKDLKVAHILVTEFPDKKFYGFLFGSDQQVYYIANTTYKLVKVPTPGFSYKTDNLGIIGNMFNWNVSVISEKGKNVYALNAHTMEVKDSIVFPKVKNRSKAFAKYIFPFQIKFTTSNYNFVKPQIALNGIYFLWSNLLLLALYVIFSIGQKRKLGACQLICIAITGIFGFITSLIINLDK